jgi:hypothetical protein
MRLYVDFFSPRGLELGRFAQSSQSFPFNLGNAEVFIPITSANKIQAQFVYSDMLLTD